MSEKKKSDVSIANVLAIIGLAGLGVITFFGELFKSVDGRPTLAIIYAVVYVGLLAFFLIFSIKAKGAEDHPDKWRYAEVAFLAAFVFVSIMGSTPFHRFFSVVTHKDYLQSLAKSEVQSVDNLYDNYNKKQKDFLNLATQQLKNYKDSHQHEMVKGDLYDYVEKYVIDVDTWSKNASLIVSADESLKTDSLFVRINAWNYMELSSLAREIDALVETSRDKLQKHIDAYGKDAGLIPLIKGGNNGQYTYAGLAKFDLGPMEKGKLFDAISSDSVKSPLGWIVFIVLNLLVILNYLVAERTYVVGPRNRKDDQSGGLSL